MAYFSLERAFGGKKNIPQTPWGEIGYVTFKRTYARPLIESRPELGSEEFGTAIERVVNACNTQLHCGFTPDEQRELAQLLLTLKGSVAGRFLWQLGTRTVDRLGLLSLQNCAAIRIENPIRDYQWIFDSLMLGVGVGFNIENDRLSSMPVVHYAEVTHVDTADADFIVPDSREGWVALLRVVLQAHFLPNRDVHCSRTLSYSTMLVRKKGTPIKGFGGVASGPGPLIWGMGEINRLLNAHAGDVPTSVLLLDVANILGEMVVSGNVRRSAQIAIGSPEDVPYLQAKRWDIDSTPHYRSNSNNSVNVGFIESLPSEFWEGYQGNGEPYGLVNLRLAKEIGQTGDTNKKDPDIIGFNPCVEQPLCNFETCCLAEVFLPNCKTYEEFRKTVEYLYRICKHSLRLPCHWKKTEGIVHKNMRMGIGITGITQSTEEQMSWLAPCAKWMDEYDIQYSGARNWPRSIRLRTVKPSGTLSLLPGVTAGVHVAPAKYYLKRMRIATEHMIVEEAVKRGYHVEPREIINVNEEEPGRMVITHDQNIKVVDFPITHGDHTRTADDMTVTEQLDLVRRMQREWSDNGVSVTVTYKKEDIPVIQEYLRKYWRTEMKAVSFLLFCGHGFRQAPWTPITKEQYERRVQQITEPFRDGSLVCMDTSNAADLYTDASGCAGGLCPVR